MRNFVIFVLLILLVFIRYFSTRPGFQDGQKVRITGKITTVPIKYSDSQRVEIAGLKTYLPLFPEIFYGDKIVVEGVVENKDLPRGGLLKDPKLLEKVEGNNFLENFRQKIISFYQKYLPEPHASLVAGITLGAKSSLPEDFWNSLKKTGTAHVVVASGMNVTFVAGFLMAAVVLFVPRRRAIPLVLVGILFYCALAGFDAPIVRAGVMGALAFLAQETGRLASSFRILAISALLMLVFRPDWITDLGFILSFVATASLMVFQRGIEKRLMKVPNLIREGLSTSLAAQIGVTPILFVTFGYFNILSPIINALVLWTVPALMIIGATAGLIGLIIPPLGSLILYLAYPLTWWFVKVVEIFG